MSRRQVLKGLLSATVVLSGERALERVPFSHFKKRGPTDSNTLWAWGENDTGQLGDGTTTDRTTPVQIAGTWLVADGSSYMDDYDGGSSFLEEGLSYGIKTDNTLWYWGNGTNSPTQIAGSWSKVSGSRSRGALIRSDGALFKSSGSTLSALDTSNSYTFVYADSSKRNSNASHGGSAAIRSDGTLWVWDQHPSATGQQFYASLTQVSGSYLMVAGHSYGTPLIRWYIKSDGTLWQWLHDQNAMTQITGSWSYIHTCCAIKSDGSLWRISPSGTAPVSMDTGSCKQVVGSVEQSLGSGDIFYAIKSDDTLWSFQPSNSYTPVQVAGVWKSIGGKGRQFFGIKKTG